MSDDIEALVATRIIDGGEIDEGDEETAWVVAEKGHGLDETAGLDRQGQFVIGGRNPADGAGQSGRYGLAKLLQAAVHHDSIQCVFKIQFASKTPSERIVPTSFLPICPEQVSCRFVRKKSYRSIVPVRRIFFWRSNMP
jgi:hypothetical protein